MTIRAILFDLDNTLTHREKSIEAYAHYVIRHYQEKLVGQPHTQMVEIIHRIDQGGYPKKEYLTHPSIAASVAHALIQELVWHHPPKLEDLTQFWFQQFGQQAVAMQGAEELLQQLKQQGYQLAVVSNGGHATRTTILQGLGFIEYFDLIVSSELVGVSKPQPEIFTYTVEQLGRDYEECLFIGDHPINDIQGAENVGITAIWMAGFHPVDKNIRHSIQHLNQIWQFLSV